MSVFDGFDDFMADIMEQWSVPGMAVAVVQDDEIIYQKGFGYTELESKAPVTPETIFAIGSSSKAFTAMCLGILVDDGLLDWHKPLRQYMPDFELMDKFATERMNAMDLVTHRSGLPRHDLLWYNSPLSRKEIFTKLKYLEPSKDFRSWMQYQNLMFMTAGVLVEAISGKTWEEFVTERIFEPLGMTRSNCSVDDTQAGENYAYPHSKPFDGDLKQIPFRNIDAIGPAGSINSTAADMANWLRLNLNKGTFNGERIASEDVVTEMQSRQMPIVTKAMMFPFLDTHPEIGQASYGMGWFIQNYRGTKWVHHGGAIDGFIAQVAMLPQKNIGAVCLSNLGGKHAPIAVCCNIFDRLLGKESIDWSGVLMEFTDKAIGKMKEGHQELQETRHPDTQPSHELTAYVGEYEHPGYGVLTVTGDENGLAASYNNLDFSVHHFHYDVFMMQQDTEYDQTPASFISSIKGDIEEVRVQMEPNVKPIVFTRVPVKEEAAEPEAQPEEV
ncbi:serine hydrolase [Phototrophicus methaneseepsis]|uniref:Serine hydrolase n=1 Tax=Phototrophicus methaneseepsis TaxID=2710758 RepID=A0A7S8ECU2_9CHLR|nr:serine hydrolase [Phototrophicus methaneseepsis]QPC84620.1 serine hydrolase [Phototrophicus methaneseepsis]